MANLDTLSAAQLAAGVAAGDFSATDVARASLEAIDAREPEVQAFLEVSADLALAAAAKTDAARAAGQPLGPLAGVPVAVPDPRRRVGPRAPGAARRARRGGTRLSPAPPRWARAAAHFGEEPCIGGSRGAGAVFFTGCNLRCVFCQNREISRGQAGRTLTVPERRELFLRLRDQGVATLDLVTGTHYTPWIAEALSGLDLGIPVVWNSSGYDSVESLHMLEGLVQVYMPDFK